jgi:Big-like domain-containing protein
MKRTSTTLAGLVAAFAVATLSCGSTSPSPTGSAYQTGLTLVAPATIAPGSTVQLSARAMYSDGTNRDVTAQAQWHSSDTSVLTISATGLASALTDGNVTVSVVHLGTTTQAITVVPTGTFELSGEVTWFGLPVDGAVVQVTAGTGTGLSTTTLAGAFKLFGVAGPIQLRVSKTDLVTNTQTVTVSSNTANLFVALASSTPPPDFSGTYALAITADPTCTLPSEAHERTYVASVQQSGADLTVQLSGATFEPGQNSIQGTLAPEGGATFDLHDFSSFYYYIEDSSSYLAELLPDGSVYVAIGTMAVTPSGSNLVGSLNGTIKVVPGPITPAAQCTSANHSVTFTNQSGSPARKKIRR